MKTLDTLLADLKRIDGTCGSTHAADFDNVLAQIATLKTANSIDILVEFLDDKSSYDELMFSIVHLIETFPDDIYISRLLQKTLSFCSHAPRWASIVFMRILNSDSSRIELVRQLRNSDEQTKTAIKNLMQKINGRDVRFLAKTTPVIIAAS